MNNSTEITNVNIKYSIEAYNDGYDFSSLSPIEQEASKKFYWSRESMYALLDAENVYNYINNNSNKNLLLLTNKSWTFSESGFYKGIIIDAKKSRKPGSEDFILDIIINGNDIKHVKLTHNPDDVVLKALLKKYNGRISLIDPLELIGSVVAINVRNSMRVSRTVFSSIHQFIFFSDITTNALFNMLNLMLEQDEQKASTE